MNLSISELDTIIKNFKERPSKDDYEMVKEWYTSQAFSYPDIEYTVCVYLFLQGANIKHHYDPYSFDEHKVLVAEIRDYVERADPLYKNRRKTYLDCGSKSGYYK